MRRRDLNDSYVLSVPDYALLEGVFVIPLPRLIFYERRAVALIFFIIFILFLYCFGNKLERKRTVNMIVGGLGIVVRRPGSDQRSQPGFPTRSGRRRRTPSLTFS